jgi:glycosyltransferase involved in cell wall biosynthesis
MPNVNYHGSVSNDEIREALQKTHVLAYPNTYQETGCCTAIEAMSAGCVVVCPNWGVLPETCSNFAWMYGMVQDKQEHARKHAYVLNEALDSYWKEEIQMGLTFQTRYFNTFYDVDVVSKQWEMMLMALRSRRASRCSSEILRVRLTLIGLRSIFTFFAIMSSFVSGVTFT